MTRAKYVEFKVELVHLDTYMMTRTEYVEVKVELVRLDPTR